MNEDWNLLETTPPVYEALKTESVRNAMDNGYSPHLVLSVATLIEEF